MTDTTAHMTATFTPAQAAEYATLSPGRKAALTKRVAVEAALSAAAADEAAAKRAAKAAKQAATKAANRAAKLAAPRCDL